MVEYRVRDKRGDYVLVELRGELANQFWTATLRRALEDHFVDDGVRQIRLDLSPVRFVDNYGIATLVALHGESRQRGKQLIVEGARAQVREKLRMTGVLKLLEGEA